MKKSAQGQKMAYALFISMKVDSNLLCHAMSISKKPLKPSEMKGIRQDFGKQEMAQKTIIILFDNVSKNIKYQSLLILVLKSVSILSICGLDYFLLSTFEKSMTDFDENNEGISRNNLEFEWDREVKE